MGRPKKTFLFLSHTFLKVKTSRANMKEEPTKQFSRFHCGRCEKVDGNDGDGDDDFVPQNFTSSVPSLLLYGL